MMATLAIFRREWAAYFRTPAGWAVLALFLALQGLVFWMFVRVLAQPDAPSGGVMEWVFGGTMLYWIALALLATVLPMRLVAEERRTGTIEPLLTAPVAPIEVVLGKWLAALAFFAVSWAPTLLYVVYLRTIGATLDPGPIAAGYLGTLLIGGAALAVGLLASTITRNQLVAATLSFVAFFVVLLAGALEGMVRSAALAAALRRLSLFRTMEDFGHGIVDSRPILQLMMVTVLALLAATAMLARLRGPLPADAPHRRWPPGRIAAVLIVAIALMTQILAGRHFVRGDWTRQSLYALSPKTISVLEKLPRPVETTIFLYPGRDSERARAITGLLRELVERCRRVAGDRFRAEFVDPDRDPQRAEAASRRYNIGAYEMGQGAIVFASGARSKVVTWEDLVEPEVDDAGQATPALHAWRGEEAFVSAILTVTSEEPLRICFSAGHGEPGIDSPDDGGYSTFADGLRRDGDEVRALEHIGDATSAGCRVVVVAEPQQALPAAEIAALRAFADANGRVLVMLGPVFTHDGRAFAHIGLESFAKGYGVRLGDNLVVDPAHASDVEGPSVWAAGPGNYGSYPLMARFGDRLTYWPRTREVATENQPWGVTPYTRSRLVTTSRDGWGETDMATIRGEADLTFDPKSDRKGPVSVAVAVEGSNPDEGPPTRVVFLGTGRLVMNVRLAGLTLRDYDADFVMSVIAWLSDRDERIGIGPKLVGRTAPGLTGADVDRALWLFVVGLPFAVLVAGAVTWVRRRQ